MATNIRSKRYPLIDAIRGFAILLMIFFHTFFDLTYYGVTQIDFMEDPFWFALPRLIVFLFFSCVGISLVIVHGKGMRWKSWLKHLYPIVLGAFAVTLGTYYIFPENYVVFGTLHCIAASCLLAPLFIFWPRLSLLLALVIFVAYNFISPWEFPDIKFIIEKSVDIIPLYPWGAVVLFGIFMGHFREGRWYQIDLKSRFFFPLLFLGRHSLAVYLIHQPLILGILWLLLKLLSKI